jgi:hypothetical protein
MPDKQPTLRERDDSDVVQREILYALTEPGDNQTLWTIEDLAREMEDRAVIDKVNALHRAGLIHRTSDGYIFASRAAARQIQLVGHGII